MTSIIIADNAAATLQWLHVGPKYSLEYYAAQDELRAAAPKAFAAVQRLDGEQVDWEAEYGRRWAENVRRIAAGRRLDVAIISDASAQTATEAPAEDWAEDAAGEVLTLERVIALQSHDATLADVWVTR